MLSNYFMAWLSGSYEMPGIKLGKKEKKGRNEGMKRKKERKRKKKVDHWLKI